MSLTELTNALVRNTVDLSLPCFLPELILCATIVLMLLLKVPVWGRRLNMFWVALIGVGAALSAAAPLYFLGSSPQPVWVPQAAADGLGQELFSGLLIYDSLSVFLRSLLLVFAFLFVVLTRLTGIPDNEEAPDFYTLVLGSLIGMCLMVTSNHMLMVFLGVEMASVPAYVLAGTLKGRRVASEASLKFAVFGAGAAGVMLYGISLLAGCVGSVHLPTMAERLADLLASGGGDKQVVLLLGGLMVAVGMAFKLSAVPFHFWAPDVFEGATAEIGAFLSVASKAAALGLLIRLAVAFSGGLLPADVVAVAPASVPETAPVAPTETSASTAPLVVTPVSLAQPEAPAKAEGAAPAEAPPVSAPDAEPTPVEPSTAVAASEPASGRRADLAPVRTFLVSLIGLLAALTATWGNLAAYFQTNIKRLLAYSTVAHAGYMMMPVAAVVAMLGDPAKADMARDAVGAVGVYLVVYLFMNLGAFAVVAFLRNLMRSEEIADYAGLIRSCPGVAICMSLILLSLIGVPPLAGFMAKVYIFGAMVNAQLWWLLAVGGANAVLSLFYYLRVVKVMTLDPPADERLPVRFSLLQFEGLYLVALTLPLVFLLVWWESIEVWTGAAAAGMF